MVAKRPLRFHSKIINDNPLEIPTKSNEKWENLSKEARISCGHLADVIFLGRVPALVAPRDVFNMRGRDCCQLDLQARRPACKSQAITSNDQAIFQKTTKKHTSNLSEMVYIRHKQQWIVD